MNHLLVATSNKGKLAEILRIFSAEIPQLQLHTLDEFPDAQDVEENGDSFEANALLKARAGFELSGWPTLADDSGLVIDALDGRPGIHSARYSGLGDAGNIAKVLSELSEIEPDARTARFVTVAAFVDGSGDSKSEVVSGDLITPGEVTTRGELEGVIAVAPRGEGGFGYDPIFIPEGRDATLAEFSPAEKDEISHRGRALRLIAPLVGLRFAQIQRPVE